MAIKCGQASATARNPHGGLIALKLYCHSWQCNDCGPRNKRRIIRKCISAVPTRFLTLTWRPRDSYDAAAAADVISASIPKLFKRIRRRWPNDRIEYLLVWELTKAGQPHVHIVVRGPFIPQRWLSQQWNDLTNSPIVDIRTIHNANDVAHYIGKYLTKDLVQIGNHKRYSKSRAFCAHEPASTLTADLQLTDWNLVEMPVEALMEHWTNAGIGAYYWHPGVLIGVIPDHWPGQRPHSSAVKGPYQASGP